MKIFIKKRQVKSPKIYFRDSGLLHYLLGIETMDQLQHNPKLGASWEGLALEQIIQHHMAEAVDCYFWATHSHAELDLLIVKEGKRVGFEFKYADTPKITHSMLTAIELLHLDSLAIIVPNNSSSYPLSEKIIVQGLE